MSSEPLVSVKMITYNHEPYIAQAIEGVINQKTDFSFELVIGEDCSTDNTRQIVLEYQKKYPDIIKVITSEANVGVKQNSQRTTKLCSGKYIAYCEGDDFWHNENKLDNQVKFLEKHEDYALIHSNVDNLNLINNIMSPSYCVYNPEYDDDNAYFDILSSKREVSTLTVCARKHIINEVLSECPECTDEKYPMGDLQLWLEVSRRGKVKYLKESLATYRALPNSASRGSNDKTLRFSLAAKDIRYHYLSKYDCPDLLATQIRINLTAGIFKQAIRFGMLGEANTELEELRRLTNKPPLSWKDYIWYWSCKNKLLQRIVEIVNANN